MRRLLVGRRAGKRRAIPPPGTESLDAPHLDGGIARATLRDLARANALFGLRSAVRRGLRRLLGRHPTPRELTLLDVGAGAGDVTREMVDRWLPSGARVRAVALDHHREAARLCRDRGLAAVVADATRLPVGPRSVDIVIASQLLHHFSRPAGVELVRAFDRVARVGVVIADDRPSAIARWGFWLASFALGFHRVTRRDGLVSIRRGFAPAELVELLRAAGVHATVFPTPWWRVVAVWRSTPAGA